MRRTYLFLFFLIVIVVTAIFTTPAFSQAGTVLQVAPTAVIVAQVEAVTNFLFPYSAQDGSVQVGKINPDGIFHLLSTGVEVM